MLCFSAQYVAASDYCASCYWKRGRRGVGVETLKYVRRFARGKGILECKCKLFSLTRSLRAANKFACTQEKLIQQEKADSPGKLTTRQTEKIS